MSSSRFPCFDLFDNGDAMTVARSKSLALTGLQRPRPTACLGDADFAPGRVSHYSACRATVLGQSEVDTVKRQPNCEVRGPADRVEEPVGRTVCRRRSTSFLTDNRVAERFAKGFPDSILCIDVRSGNEVAITLRLDQIFRNAIRRNFQCRFDGANG